MTTSRSRSPMCSASPSLAPTTCAIAPATSPGSRTASNPTQNTPRGSAPRHEWRPRSQAGSSRPTGAGQRQQPTNLPPAGRARPPAHVPDQRTSSPGEGGCCSKSSSTEETNHPRAEEIDTGPSMSFSRCSPRSRSTKPAPAAERRRRSRQEDLSAVARRGHACARWTSSPTYPSLVTSGVPVCKPTRARSGPAARWLAICAAAAAALAAVVNARVELYSPWVSTSTPPWDPHAERTTCLCSARAAAYCSARRARAGAASSPRYQSEGMWTVPGRQVCAHVHVTFARSRSAQVLVRLHVEPHGEERERATP